jgi:transcriptional regulator with XRE-family HTH domain
MGTKPRHKPEHLAEELLAIRQELEASQSEMAALLGHYITPSRVSECERGIREPNLMVLLAYARLARVKVEVLIDDKKELPQRFYAENGTCTESP